MRSYAIGDIHGQRTLLALAHARIARDRAECGDEEAPVIHLGDLVDRGPDSAGVIADLREGIAAGRPWVVIKGNHDRLFQRFVDSDLTPDPYLRSGLDWLAGPIGGQATLTSYGIDCAGLSAEEARARARSAVPERDLDFLRGLPLTHHRAGALFVHAGIRPGVALPAQTEDDLLWIRDPFLLDPRDHGFLVVHGHTALKQPLHYRNRLNLDSGAAYGGPLTAAVIEDGLVSVLTDTGRVPLAPH